VFPTNIKSGLKSALLLGVSSAAVGLSIPAAYADTVETVVVTGSRIANRDFSSDSPIQTVSAESLKATGVVEVSALLNTLPQVVPAFSSGSNNPPSGGLQAVDLRGLGPNRNLVLINGRRAAPSTIAGVVDIQTIPQSLISRIEVVTGGESSVYGPDAITGVVNFILKDDFEGAEGDAQYGISERGDNITESASATIGGNFADGKGNAVITFDWAKRNPVNDSQRDFASQATTQTSFFPDGVYRPNGANLPSQAAYNSYFAAHGGASAYAPAVVDPVTGVIITPSVGVKNSQALVINPDGTLFNAGGLGTDGVFNIHNDPSFPAKLFCADPANHSTCQTYSYNFQPPNLLILPLNRRNLMGTAHYDINQYVTAYGEVRFTSYHSASSLAPSPAPTSGVTAPNGSACGGNYCVPVSNPFITPDLAGFLASRTGDAAGLVGVGAGEDFQIRTRFLQEGPRLQDNGINTYQVTGGLKGNLPWWNNSLHYDVFASYGNNDTLSLQFGNVSNSAVEKMLYGKATDGACAGIAGGYCGYDWAGANQASPESMAYAARIAKNSTNTTFTNIEASIGGDLWELPAGAMSFSFGGDYREQTYNFIPDPLLSSGDISGFNGGQAVAGAVYDREVFGELYVPVLKDREWAESVSLTLGGRYTNQANTTNGSPYTWKVEGDWTIVHGLTLRGSWGVSTRVPNIGELFSTTFQNQPTLADPCDANGPFRTGPNKVAVQALCAAQSAAAGADSYVQPTGQISARSGGTATLSPETANTFTVGASWQSDLDNPWISNFKASVDYWNIDLHGPIGIDFFDILYGCFNVDGSNPTYSNANPNCARIIRSPGTGSIYYLNAFSGNLSKNQLDGIDVAVAWGLDLADTVGADPQWGNLGFNLNGTWLHEFNVQGTKGAKIFNYAGTIGATSPIGLTTDAALPKWKATLTTTWNLFDDFSLSNRINYISAMKNTLDLVGWSGFPFGTGPVTGTPATWYFDLSGSWAVTDHITVRGGVNNLFDQAPRIYNPSQQDGTDPATYDIVGRSYFFGVNVKY
jgi:outer membrane receptor protein involved in Fe transport